MSNTQSPPVTPERVRNHSPHSEKSKHTPERPQRQSHPTTPLNASTMPTEPLTTPLVKKESATRPYTSMHSQRDDRITAMWTEISGRVVGGISMQEFLKLYLPESKSFSFNASSENAFLKVKSATSELAMYVDWVCLYVLKICRKCSNC
jgi:hypothetical protein